MKLLQKTILSLAAVVALSSSAIGNDLSHKITAMWYPSNSYIDEPLQNITPIDSKNPELKAYKVANINSNVFIKGDANILTNLDKYNDFDALDENSLVTEFVTDDVYGCKFWVYGEAFKGKDLKIYKKVNVLFATKNKSIITLQYLLDVKANTIKTTVTDAVLPHFHGVSKDKIITSLNSLEWLIPTKDGIAKDFISISTGGNKSFNELLKK